MPLKVHNTMTSQMEEFTPIEGKKVKMYVCGVTVYNDIHMGHARSIVVFDMIARYLRYKGYQVTYLTNFTDVDDKIINRANEMGMDPLALSRMYIERYFEDVKLLGARKADMYPKASESIEDIIVMVQRIIDTKYGYVTPDGSVYFSVENFPKYGKLSGNKLEDMQAGARIEVDDIKRNPMDFCLWKATKPGEISWKSPWGEGRPGWHIECSAMISQHMGDTIDIHGGGNDLIFPHHENEILQSESVTGKPLAKYWMHNGMLQISGDKMSKSLNNFFTIKDVLKDYDPLVVRFFLLNTHYRKPIDFNQKALAEAAQSLGRLQNTLDNVLAAHKSAPSGDVDFVIISKEAIQKFDSAMDEDFNTRDAISTIFDFSKEVNKYLETKPGKESLEGIIGTFRAYDELLSIFKFEKSGEGHMMAPLMDMIIGIRQKARADKNFALADEIRDRLKELGIVLEDTAEGVKWKVI
jgi:cysteinyl-tRNA synthetase